MKNLEKNAIFRHDTFYMIWIFKNNSKNDIPESIFRIFHTGNRFASDMHE